MTPTPDADHLADHVLATAAALELLATAPHGVDAQVLEQLSTLSTDAYQRIEARETAHPALAAVRLARTFALSATEMQTLWLLAAVALRREVRMLVGRCTGEPTPDPTPDGLRTVVYGDRSPLAAVRELGPRGALRRFDLIERSDGGDDAVHDSRRTWAVSRRVLGLLCGDDALDPEVTELQGARTRELGVCIADPTLAAARAALGRSAPPSPATEDRRVIIAAGLPGLGRRTLLIAVARAAGLDVLDVDARRMATDEPTFRRQVRAVLREARLQRSAPLFAHLDALGHGADRRLELLGQLVDASALEGPILATTGVHRPRLEWRRPIVVVEVAHPSTAHRSRLWRSELGPQLEHHADHLATCYPLAPALVIEAGAAARARAGDGAPDLDDVQAGIRTVLDGRLGDYARRVTTTQTWDDIVLPSAQLAPLVELLARVRQRGTVYEQWGFADKVGKGLGITALFSGPPGTGKTMVAALLAQDLGIELYQVDLARIVSKFIGETEQHLAALFDAAEAGHAILLFDEADSLFGKRTDVKSSNDRFANLETNYLLQRLETFTGICLLTSNHERNIDPAFQRRLSLHLRFELPELDERTLLWRATLPAAAPVDADVDFASLGERYVMSGGYIKNAVLRAAFLAAEDGRAITADHLERAARIEYEGMGKITHHAS